MESPVSESHLGNLKWTPLISPAAASLPCKPPRDELILYCYNQVSLMIPTNLNDINTAQGSHNWNMAITNELIDLITLVKCKAISY